MKKTHIYVDTSVIGGCCDPEFRDWSRGLLSDFQSVTFSLLLSELTDAEIQDAPEDVQIFTPSSEKITRPKRQKSENP